jgi:hypothetical protein
MAVSRVAAMVFSAWASFAESWSSSVLRSASEAAFSFSRVSLPMACARDHAADARQRNPRHDHIERDEGDEQRNQLRSEGARIERRK